MRALVPVGLVVLLATPAAAPAQTFYGVVGRLSFWAPEHQYASSLGPLPERYNPSFTPAQRWAPPRAGCGATWK